MENIEKPFDYFGKNIGKKVRVYLKNGALIEGILKAFDIHLNLVLTNVSITVEVEEEEITESKESLFVRGDNVLFVEVL